MTSYSEPDWRLGDGNRLLCPADRAALLVRTLAPAPTMTEYTERQDTLILMTAERLEDGKKVTLSGSSEIDAVAAHFAALGHRVSLLDMDYHIYPKEG